MRLNRTQQGIAAEEIHGGNAMEHEMIDSIELARRWSLPTSWVREHTRARALDPIPHIRFGKYVRFRRGSPELNRWLEKRISR
jgi:hypothetical protein